MTLEALQRALEQAYMWELNDNSLDGARDAIAACRRAIVAALAAPAVSPGGWQPIESAPKDRPAILLVDGMALQGRWIQNEWYGDWCWRSENVRCRCGGANSGLPTHWMPLPEPPADALEPPR